MIYLRPQSKPRTRTGTHVLLESPDHDSSLSTRALCSFMNTLMHSTLLGFLHNRLGMLLHAYISFNAEPRPTFYSSEPDLHLPLWKDHCWAEGRRHFCAPRFFHQIFMFTICGGRENNLDLRIFSKGNEPSNSVTFKFEGTFLKRHIAVCVYQNIFLFSSCI